MAEEWNGPERRAYCAQHCMVKETGKRSTPWRFYVGSMSAVLLIAISYVGINETRMNEIKMHFEKGIAEHEIHVTERMTDAQSRYSQDVGRFIREVTQNRIMLRELGKEINTVNVRLGKAEAKQDMVLKKIKITE
jgi:hypothetical protein